MAASPTDRGERAGPGGTLRTLELGRFAAALLVALTHVCATLPFYAARGHDTALAWGLPGALAVQYFFVLSGFVLAVVHGGDRALGWRAAPRFLRRRACRIFPMYWLALALAVCASGLPAPARVLPILTLWPTWTRPELVATAWTLRYEVGFYLVFALCLLPRVGLAFGVLWLAGTIANCFAPGAFRAAGLPVPAAVRALSGPVAGHLFYGVNFLFLAGAVAGALHRRGGAIPPRMAGPIAIAGALLVVALLPRMRWGHDFGISPFIPPTEGVGLAALLLGLAGLERAGRLRMPDWTLPAGALSYPLYILHWPVVLLLGLPLAGRREGEAGVAAVALLMLVAVGLVSVLATFAIDRPVQRLLRPASRRVRAARAAA